MKVKIISKKYGFTLVELLVVTSIITIISFVGITSFFDFAETQEINSKIMLFGDEIEELDKKVKNKEIFDYTITFQKNSSTFSGTKYKIVENNFNLDKYIQISQIYGIGDITLKNSGSEKFFVKIYKGGKFLMFSGALDNYNLKIDDNFDYKITGYLGGTTLNELNSIYIKSYDQNENILFLSDLTNTLENTTRNEITLQNISGKKTFPGINENKVKLYFEKSGRRNFIELDN